MYNNHDVVACKVAQQLPISVTAGRSMQLQRNTPILFWKPGLSEFAVIIGLRRPADDCDNAIEEYWETPYPISIMQLPIPRRSPSYHKETSE